MIPFPIETAPKPELDHEPVPILLFCPDEGGGHTGIWFEASWRLHADVARAKPDTKPEPHARRLKASRSSGELPSGPARPIMTTCPLLGEGSCRVNVRLNGLIVWSTSMP